MMKRIRKYILLFLILVGVFSLNIIVKSFDKKEIKKIKEENIVDSSIFAMYLGNSNGEEYVEYDSDTFPINATFNQEKSYCVDMNSTPISNVLSYDEVNKKVILQSTKTSFCYLYFDKKLSLDELCKSGEKLGECLLNNNESIESLNDNVEGGLHRYQGTNEVVYDNYICFGTTNKEECINNTDAYMYRIMGINSNKQVKLIKKEALNSRIKWYSDYTTDIKWPQSLIYQEINGDSFLNNTTYVPDDTWKNKIADIEWKYGDNDQSNITALELYTIENGWTAKTEPIKIGIIYVHDYYYGLSGGNDCYTAGSTCKTSWLYLSNNDTGAPDRFFELTMSRYGGDTNRLYFSWSIDSGGSMDTNSLSNGGSARPVFYLTEDELYISGSGTIDDPIIISEPSNGGNTGDNSDINKECQNGDNLGECLLNNNGNIEDLSDNLEAGLHRYQGTDPNNYICFGTTDKDTCTSNTEAYMYRIIGIDESNEVKLIKKEAFSGTKKWNSTYNSNITWPNSELFKNINGSTFLGNTRYLPNDTWKEKIADTEWKYGDITDVNMTAEEVYTVENGWTTTTSAKIGLMYVHDYIYSFSKGNNCTYPNGNYRTCKTSWLFIGDNGDVEVEWLMSRYGDFGDGYYIAWLVDTVGSVDNDFLHGLYSVRPVFNLKSNVTYASGSGTIDDPYIVGALNSSGTSSNESSDISTICKSGDLLGECLSENAENIKNLSDDLVAGLHRYQGTNPNNYICFGTTNKSTCTGNTDANMYRIIGVTDSGQIKLIKKEALNSGIKWHTSFTSNTTWQNSNMYQSINGSSYLNNATYMPSEWSSKISSVSWKYGDITFNDETRSEIYSVENGWKSTIAAKIGLMYIHDYYYSLSNDYICSLNEDYATCKTSWLHLSNNDTSAPYGNEWTMSRRGVDSSGTYANLISSDGSGESSSPISYSNSARPVFYLNANVQYTGGTGTIDNPFLIS